MKRETPTFRSLGQLRTDYLESKFGALQTQELIITADRIAHIHERHPEDAALFEEYGCETALDPDLVLVDEKHAGTVFMIRKLPDTNLNVVVRVALETDASGYKNSIMTFYRIREKNLRKLAARSEILYKKA